VLELLLVVRALTGERLGEDRDQEQEEEEEGESCCAARAARQWCVRPTVMYTARPARITTR
jgi:hypothetical protein